MRSDFREPCFAYKFGISVIDWLVKCLVVSYRRHTISFKFRIVNYLKTSSNVNFIINNFVNIQCNLRLH